MVTLGKFKDFKSIFFMEFKKNSARTTIKVLLVLNFPVLESHYSRSFLSCFVPKIVNIEFLKLLFLLVEKKSINEASLSGIDGYKFTKSIIELDCYR